ncbi:type II toxin-antitoxin system RelB/DinJ family antitoxin [Patescibacteria group bacterium]|nr:type II toxin-antitoxin system RelB/DinJ family antitoxin [Patescibacteria group bacterium]
MDTAVINIRVDQRVKTQAQDVVEKLGLSLSAVINGFLKTLVRTKRVEFDVNDEEPSEYLIQSLKQSEADYKAGRVSPAFDDVDEAIVWLEDKNRKYANQV